MRENGLKFKSSILVMELLRAQVAHRFFLYTTRDHFISERSEFTEQLNG